MTADAVTWRALSADRVDWHLWNWERWQQHSVLPGRYPNHASGGLRGYSSLDIDSEYHELDRSAGASVQAILDGMVPRLRLAVYVRHHITRVYILRGSVDEAYDEARGILAAGLAQRGVF